MKAKLIISFLLMIVIRSTSWTQSDSIAPLPSLGLEAGDSIALNQNQILFSKDSLDAPVDYNAVDSMIFDVSGQKVFLYGNAEVKYTTITLKADYIVLDWSTNIVIAEGLPDSLGKMAGFPEFKDGEQAFEAERMRYNFQTRKGIVYDVTTNQNDVVVHGSKSKFISKEPNDTTSNDIVFSEDAIFTTCTHPEPHFGIRSKKQKIVPNKLVVVGPSNVEIMGVPTPLWLPFGFFPIASGRRSGLIFPRDYEYSPQWGFGLRDIGWFFPLGDHFNLAVTSNIYLKGTWGINARSQYRKRYKYNGNFSLGFDARRSESSDGTIGFDKSINFRWTHQQDRAAHPSNRFGGSVNIQTNNYQSRVFNDARNVLQNQLSSNLSFQKNWPNKPFSLSASFNHTQNTATNKIDIDFPNIQFLTQTLFPFKRKERIGKEKWYETITMRYTGEIKNRFTATDTTLFQRQTLEDARFGVRHDVTSGTSFKVLKYFNVNPSVSYKEVWYLNSLEKQFVEDVTFDTTIVANSDGTRFDTTITENLNNSIIENRVNGFKPWRQFSAGVSMNTQIFGTMSFKKGWLRGLRHVIKPSIGLNFSPNYLDPGLGYFEFVQNVSNPDQLDQYSIFEDGIFGSPPASGQQMALTYSINNIFEAKVFSKRDSTDKKIKLFNNIRIGGNYNFAADSLKWSPVRMSGTTRFFKGATTLSLSAVWDPYIVDDNGRRLNQTYWRQEGKLLRFNNANASFNTRMTVGKIRALFQGKEEEYVEDIQEQQNDRRALEDDFLSLFENFSINHNFSVRWDKSRPDRDTIVISTNSLNFQGSIQLTNNWSINIGNFGYDFVRKGLSYPSVGFQRDLHCWELGMSWQPTRGTYSFYIQVKPGTLDFLKIPFQRNNADAGAGFR